MQKSKQKQNLPHFPIFVRFSTKLALGLILLFFLLDYQPALSFPPLKKSTVRAAVNEQTQTIEAKSIPFAASLPHPGYISTHFSFFHPGLDIATGLGMPIHPIAKGVVTDTGFNFWGLGLVVNIDHGNNYRSLYAHMGKIYVQTGQTVDTNDILGVVGLTGNTSGPHTHLEVSKDGKNFDPQAILPYLGNLPKAEFLTPVANNAPEKKKTTIINQTIDAKRLTDEEAKNNTILQVSSNIQDAVSLNK